jgi:hypothetical protein
MQMFKIYILQNTLEFLISALRTCVVSAFPYCHGARMNMTIFTKMLHAALYAFHIIQSINVNGIRHFDTLGSAYLYTIMKTHKYNNTQDLKTVYHFIIY